MESPFITLNGKNHPISGMQTVLSLLESLGLGKSPVVVELNAKALLPRQFAEQTLHSGDRVEIISIVAGG